MAMGLSAYMIERAKERERAEREAELARWEDEGGSGPAEERYTIPRDDDWAASSCVSGNGRWHHTGLFENYDLFALLSVCVHSTDARVKDASRDLLKKWGWT